MSGTTLLGVVRVNIVWFKRDLRVWDNEALTTAAETGAVLPLYIVEPALWAQPDLSARHYAFLKESLEALSASLTRLGQPLIIRTGDAVEILAGLAAEYDIRAIYAHQETWNGWTYQRDRRVNSWCRRAQIAFHEFQQHGVHRAMPSRRGWAVKWDAMMRQPVTPVPEKLASVKALTNHLPTAADLGLAADPCARLCDGAAPAGGDRWHGPWHLNGPVSFRGLLRVVWRGAQARPFRAHTGCLSEHPD